MLVGVFSQGLTELSSILLTCTQPGGSGGSTLESRLFFLQIELLPIGLFCRGKRAVRPPLLCLDSPNPKEQACHVHLRRSRLLSSTEHRTGVIAHRFPRPLQHIKAAHATQYTSTQTHSG